MDNTSSLPMSCMPSNHPTILSCSCSCSPSPCSHIAPPKEGYICHINSILHMPFPMPSHRYGSRKSSSTLGVETVDASHFITKRNIERLRQAKEANRVQIDHTPSTLRSLQSNHGAAEAQGDSQTGTVGCVAIDSSGYFAAATSTGGLVNKMVGRIGDTPIIGSGTYANNLCAVSATGEGESIMRHTVARNVAALMEYKGLPLSEAADHVVKNAPKGDVGLVAVSATGEVSMNFNTRGMFRACATEKGYSEISIWPTADSVEQNIDYTPTQGSLQSNHVPVEAQGDSQTGTVGCVAIDSSGYFAAATSTGGLVNKMVGRIGDTPIIGSGTYANNLCAVSATGKGESIMRHTVARDVAALMEYKGLSLSEAADHVVKNAPKGTVGLVAVSATGEVSMNFNTTGMFQACATENGYSEISIWRTTDSVE